MLMCGYEARTGNTSATSARNTPGLRNISDTGTDSPATTRGTSALSRTTRVVSSPMVFAPSACARFCTRRFSEARAYWLKS
jgi:hypothetical protein